MAGDVGGSRAADLIAVENGWEGKRGAGGLISAPRVCPPWLEDLLQIPSPPVDARLGPSL